MANDFYNRGASFNPDELADGDAIEAEFDAIGRGFDTIEDLVSANQAGYPTQTFHVAPAELDTHAVPKAQMDAALSFKLDTVNYNASDILTKLKTVDGASSGLDADYLDGQHGSYYRNASNINAGTLAKERLPGTINSSTTGTAANAELLDGLDSTRFSRSAVGQLNNYDNWDTFTSHGTYKVNSPDFTGNANAPPSTYGYGILQVEVSEIGGEDRIMQVYYPHNQNMDKYIYQRMRNAGGWTAWAKIWRGGTGDGSGLDADLLDGLDSSQFIRSDAADTITGALTSTSTISATQLIATSNGAGTNFRVGDDAWFGDVNISNTTRLMGNQDNTKGYLIFGNGDSTALGRSGTGALTYGGNTIWYAGSVAVLTGEIGHGGTLPIPSGFSEGQCRWMVSMNNDNPSGIVWDINENGAKLHYKQLVYTTGRVVTAQTYLGSNNSPPGWISSTANYIIIGVK